LPDGVRDIIHNSVATKRGGLRFGFVSQGFCFGHWFLQNQGRCEWLVGSSEPPVKQAHDPDFYEDKETDIAKLLLTKPVDVFVSFDAVPGCNHPAWSSRTTKAIVWISAKQLRKGSRFPRGWTVSASSVSHNKVGGVTTGRYWIGVGVRSDQQLVTWDPTSRAVPDTLSQIIDQKLGGRRTGKIAPSNHCLRNTALGLLQWEDRFQNVIVPTVYSKSHWTPRKLSNKELTDALDIPATIARKANPKVLKRLTSLSTPGKIISYVLNGLTSLEEDDNRDTLAGFKRQGTELKNSPCRRRQGEPDDNEKRKHGTGSTDEPPSKRGRMGEPKGGEERKEKTCDETEKNTAQAASKTQITMGLAKLQSGLDKLRSGPNGLVPNNTATHALAPKNAATNMQLVSRHCRN
jgi:hypothetical protein